MNVARHIASRGFSYYAFGMEMPGRKYQSASSHRYGFNGQEKDDEIAGSGNILTAEYWEYDARIGRRWNEDPVVFDWQSPYACFNNNPIYFSDPKGLEGEPPKKGDTKTNEDGTVNTYDGKDWQKTPVGEAQSPQHPIVLEDAVITCPDCVKSAPTSGPEKGQPAPPTDTPGNYTSEGIEIKDFSKGGRQYLDYHDFLAQPSISFLGTKWDINKNELSMDLELSHKFPNGAEPKVSLSTDGKYTTGINGATASSGGDVNFFELAGRSTNINQFAQINNGPQPVFLYPGLVLTVPTSTTIYTYIEKSTFKGLVKRVNLTVIKHTMYYNKNTGIVRSPSTVLIDTNYIKGRVALGMGKGKIKVSVGLE